MKQTISGELVEKAVKKFPINSSWSVARYLKQEYPLVFKDVVNANTLVRQYRGLAGHGDKKQKDRKEAYEAQLPKPIKMKYEPYILPKVNNNCLILSDLHIPFHDKEAVKLALEYGKQKGINTIIFLGDVVDMYELSFFQKEPHMATFEQEREQFWLLIEYIYTILPGIKIFYYEGNHEMRFQHYMLNHAPEIFGVSEFSIRYLFNLDELGITWIGDKQTIKAGKLNLLHGHEYLYNSVSVNPAKWLFLRAKDNAMMGHRHQVNSHSGNVINGHVITCWSIGCLCNVHPKYMPLNEWQQGFGYLEILDDKNFVFHNKTIIGDRIY